jgi:DNA polymerase-3 subunit gamma/tau
MNQCDINYRQSSNKRLLVELTLIEIAQITQADDSASAGRSPRRLKSLFKHLIRQSTQPQTAAPQVAAAEPVASPHPASAPQEKSTAVGNPPLQAPSPKPGIKLGGLGFSWSNLRNNDKKSGKMNIIPGTPADNSNRPRTDMPFTQEDLELQWLSMCNRMPQEHSGIAARMKNMTPVITEGTAVEVTVDNALVKQDIDRIFKSILKTLQIYLNNSQLTLTILVSEKPAEVKILTRREQFEQMREKNPAVEALRQAFDLELA